MIASGNIKKTKSVSIILTVMFLIAALLLNTGLLVTLNYGSFFGRLKTELSPADVYYAIPDALFTDKTSGYLDGHSHVKKTQVHDAMWLGAKIDSNDKERNYTVLFQNMDEKREISKWKYVGEHLPQEEMSVYIPDLFRAVYGYQLNDKIVLNYTENTGEEKKLTFTVRGYTEDIFFSSTDTGMLGFYLPEATYKEVQSILDKPGFHINVVHAKLDDIKNAAKVESGLRDILQLNSSSMFTGDADSMIVVIDLELVQLSRCMMASMVAAMMVVFALIIVIVCLLVVRFRIVNSIEDDMMKIGSLKAAGYTSGQIRLSLLLQYLLIASLGSIAGIFLSYPIMPGISLIFEQQSGLKWEQGFDPVISLISLLTVTLIVTSVALLAARRVNKLSPINALRGDSGARKYTYNVLPLQKSIGALPAQLAIKSVLQNMKQNIMIIVILVAVTFAGSYGIIMYYNTSVDTSAFAEVPGMELTNAVASLNPEKDQRETVKAIEKMKNVRKTLFLDEVKVKLNDTDITAFIMDDYAEKETRLVYDGHYPEKSGEIVLAGILSQRIEKKIGDTVKIQVGDKTETYLVTGLSNGSSMGGMNASMLTEDYTRLNPDFKPQALYIYLNEGTSATKFTKQLEKQFDKETMPATIDFDKMLADGMESYRAIVEIMGIAMLIITLLVVTLVLYFMISSSVIRRKKELGIQKAIGFTTFQLMNQMSIIFALPVVIGAAIGSIAGAFGTNPMMSVVMRSAGVMKAGFIVSPPLVVLFGAGTVVFSYALSLLITWRIRKISAYALVTE